MKRIFGFLFMSLFGLALSSPVLAEDPPRFLLKWGSFGTEPGQFIFPTGITTDSLGYVYIADTWGLKLNKFSASGTFINAWQIGSEPRYVAADSLGNVYFNSSAGPVYKKDANDQLSIFIQGPTLTKGIAVDAYNNIYVQDLSESEYGTIDKYDSNGTFIKTVVSGVHDTPLAIDRNNNLLYLRQANDIVKYDLDGVELARWGTTGPWGDIALDSNGNVHIVDTLDSTNGHVKKYSPDGTLLISWGAHGTAEGQFWEPYGIAIDSSGNMYISDKTNMIQKFAPPCVPVTGNQAIDAAVCVIRDANGNLVYTDPETGLQTHGTYVSAVAFKALELRNAGLITQADFNVIMRKASNSDVNKKNQ